MLNETAVLRADRLGRSVPGRQILADISFGADAGELLVILGASGAGKSSLLRLLNRLDEPTEGTVYLGGEDYRAIAPRELRRRVGMVMQRPFLFPGTVADNIRFGPRQRGQELSSAEVGQLLASVGLGGFAGRTVDKLSGGEAQRVSVARTLANEPAVVLMDEPTSALDEASKLQVEHFILQAVRDRHAAGLLVTHDSAQAARIADRVLMLEGGRMKAIGLPQEVLRVERA
jgi:ABC-type iron transport system FetAB ATPase subunit